MFGSNNCLCMILLMLLFCGGGCCNNGDSDSAVQGIFNNDALMALLIGAVLGAILTEGEENEENNCTRNGETLT